MDDRWNPDEKGNPAELYLNAGPGRIPSYHNAVLDHCRKFGVKLEPYTFVSRYNLLQKDGWNHHVPVKIGELKHALRREIAEILAKAPQFYLKSHISKDEMASFQALLRDFGDLNRFASHDRRRGYLPGQTPGAFTNDGRVNPLIDLSEILSTDNPSDGIWRRGLFSDMTVHWQTALMQPAGGMDRLWVDMLSKKLPDEAGGGTIESLVHVNAEVTLVEHYRDVPSSSNEPVNRVRVAWMKDGQTQSETFDFCISTMGPKRLKKVIQGFDSTFQATLAKVGYTNAAKVGWQAPSRWWEDDYEMYGGISWIHHEISQMWYPSQDFHSHTGTLTGAYNAGSAATNFGKRSLAERLAIAAEGGAKLHGVGVDYFKKHMVYYDRGVSVEWGNMPFQDGGWVEHALSDEIGDDRRYTILSNLPQGALFLAGDWMSHTPGWMEGSLRSALATVYHIADRCRIGGPDVYGVNCRYEHLSR